jgi:hypothetical protein
MERDDLQRQAAARRRKGAQRGARAGQAEKEYAAATLSRAKSKQKKIHADLEEEARHNQQDEGGCACTVM